MLIPDRKKKRKSCTILQGYIFYKIFPPPGGGKDNLEIFTEGKIIEKVHARAKRAREAHNFCEEKMEIWRKWGKIKENTNCEGEILYLKRGNSYSLLRENE